MKYFILILTTIVFMGCSPRYENPEYKELSDKMLEVEKAMMYNYVYRGHNDYKDYRSVEAAIIQRNTKPNSPFCDVMKEIKASEVTILTRNTRITDVMLSKQLKAGGYRCELSSNPSLSYVSVADVTIETLEKLKAELPKCNKAKVSIITSDNLTESTAQSYLRECLQFQIEQELQR